MTMPRDVIIIEDDVEVLEASQQTLELAGLGVTACRRPFDALPRIDRNCGAVVLCDVRMPGADGFAVLEKIRAIDPEIPVILISGHADISMATRAIRSGAYDFIEKPADPGYVIELVKRALNHRRLVLSHRNLRQSVVNKAIETRIIGHSPAMRALRDMIMALAQVDATVLVLGETGTGKELVARCLHDFSGRSRGPFVAINCAALQPSMLESELFGHEAGAFTGAKDKRIGKIEFADRGTLFLDEIESMPLEAQARLLRVLQERQLERLGSNKLIAVDIRVVAATKADLSLLARQGHFREDLVYRLAVVPLAIPSLRERGAEDIEFLFRHFFDEAVRTAGPIRRPMPDLAPVIGHSWPGNVRELRNAAERAALGFPALGSMPRAGAEEPASDRPPRTLGERMADHERRELQAALAAGKRLQDTAADLGISRKTLYLKLREHGLSSSAEPEEPDEKFR